MNDTREIGNTIFELVPVGPAKEKKPDPTLGQKAQAAAATIFHNAPQGEPDWAGILMKEGSAIERMKIREMREAWEYEQKVAAHQKAQEAQEQKIQEALSAPLRNKAFYAKLQAEQPRVYYSPEAQRAMKRDKRDMGLNFHLKG